MRAFRVVALLSAAVLVLGVLTITPPVPAGADRSAGASAVPTAPYDAIVVDHYLDSMVWTPATATSWSAQTATDPRGVTFASVGPGTAGTSRSAGVTVVPPEGALFTGDATYVVALAGDHDPTMARWSLTTDVANSCDLSNMITMHVSQATRGSGPAGYSALAVEVTCPVIHHVGDVNVEQTVVTLRYHSSVGYPIVVSVPDTELAVPGTFVGGDGAPVDMVLRNAGTTTVTAGAAFFDNQGLPSPGGEFRLTADACSHATLAPGASCTMTVSLHGVSAGPWSHYATLIVPITGGGVPEVDRILRSDVVDLDCGTLTAHRAPGVVQLAWVEDVGGEGRVVQILRGPDFEHLVLLSEQSSSVTTFTDHTVVGGQSYAYAVRETADVNGPVVGPESRATIHLPEGDEGKFSAPSPARLLDTRTSNGGHQGPLAQGETFDLQVTGRGGLPATGIQSVVLNVTGVTPTAPTFITVWPQGSPRPWASNLNLVPGDVRPNLVTVGVGPTGKVSFYNLARQVHVVVDVQGYYAGPDGHAVAEYHPQSPYRSYDSRPNGEAWGPDETWLVPVSAPGIDRDTVIAVALNVTVTNPEAASFVTVFPALEDRPLASNLNFVAGQTVANVVIVPTAVDPEDGTLWVAVYNMAGWVDVVVDVQGWFDDGVAGDGLRFAPVNPTRVLDTRSTERVHQAGTVVAPTSGPAPAAPGVVANITGVAPTVPTFLTAWPGPGTYRPLASNLNLLPGEVIPNLAMVATDPDHDSIGVFNSGGDIDVVVDVSGYFW